MIPLGELFEAAANKTAARDKDYHVQPIKEAWETIPIEDLASAARYKISRAMQPNVTLAKRKDDLEDATCFIAALYERVPSEMR